MWQNPYHQWSLASGSLQWDNGQSSNFWDDFHICPSFLADFLDDFPIQSFTILGARSVEFSMTLEGQFPWHWRGQRWLSIAYCSSTIQWNCKSSYSHHEHHSVTIKPQSNHQKHTIFRSPGGYFLVTPEAHLVDDKVLFGLLRLSFGPTAQDGAWWAEGRLIVGLHWGRTLR